MISVVMPTHNRPPLLFNTILSVLSQSVDDFEFVVVDASEDRYFMSAIDELSNSSEVFAYYVQNSNKLKVVYPEKDNIYPGAMKMSGFENCTQDDDFVVFLDHDDFLGQDLLYYMKKAYDKFPDTEMFSTNYASVSYYNNQVYTNAVTYFGGEQCDETKIINVGNIYYEFPTNIKIYKNFHPFKAAMIPKIISKKAVRNGKFTFMTDTCQNDDALWPILSHSLAETYIPIVGYIYVAYITDYITTSCNHNLPVSDTAEQYIQYCDRYEKLLNVLEYKKYRNTYNIES